MISDSHSDRRHQWSAQSGQHFPAGMDALWTIHTHTHTHTPLFSCVELKLCPPAAETGGQKGKFHWKRLHGWVTLCRNWREQLWTYFSYIHFIVFGTQHITYQISGQQSSTREHLSDKVLVPSLTLFLLLRTSHSGQRYEANLQSFKHLKQTKQFLFSAMEPYLLLTLAESYF